jgi:hypothetical protein
MISLRSIFHVASARFRPVGVLAFGAILTLGTMVPATADNAVVPTTAATPQTITIGSLSLPSVQVSDVATAPGFTAAFTTQNVYDTQHNKVVIPQYSGICGVTSGSGASRTVVWFALLPSMKDVIMMAPRLHTVDPSIIPRLKLTPIRIDTDAKPTQTQDELVKSCLALAIAVSHPNG